jgi:ATP-dependent DNA ligase
MTGFDTITRPHYGEVSLQTGIAWCGRGLRWEEKLDGRWHVLAIGASRITGELMRDGRFFAFDVPIYEGQDVRRLPLRERLKILDTFPLLRPATGLGGDFLRTVLARGGEGFVAKDLDAPFGVGWTKCKRSESHDLVVTGRREDTGVLELATLAGESRGNCPAKAMFDRIAVGDLVEVACHSLTAAGKLREPRFVRCRPDKVFRMVDGHKTCAGVSWAA